MEHKVYTGLKFRGHILYPFGKCTCGAYLDDQDQIDEHKELEAENDEKILRQSGQ